MTIPHPGTVQIDETGKVPTVQNDVGQAVISMEQHLRMKIFPVFPHETPGFLPGREAPFPRKKLIIIDTRPIILPGFSAIGFTSVRYRAFRERGFVKLAEQIRQRIAQAAGIFHIPGVQTVLSRQFPGQKPVLLIGQVSGNLGPQTFPPEVIRHCRFRGKRARCRSFQIVVFPPFQSVYPGSF